MRKRIWVSGIIACAIIVALLLFKSKERKTELPAPPQQAQALQTNQSGNSTTGENLRITNSQPKAFPSTPQNATSLALAIAETNPAAARVLANWQTPIDFYGKVVDENNSPIAGARVTFNWVEVPAEDGNRTTKTESNAEGLFSITGQRGPDLGIAVSKEGYYPRKGGARYGPIGNPDFIPDPRKPILFTLKKKGIPAESLISMKQNYRIARDGTPVAIDLATGAKANGDNGNLVVRCWTMDQGKQSAEKYDWRCTLTSPGGGIVPISAGEEFPFLAPETGYNPSWETNMPASGTNWNSQVDQRFYYHLADGRYGIMTFSMIAGGQYFFMVDSVLNPSGSKNLERGGK